MAPAKLTFAPPEIDAAQQFISSEIATGALAVHNEVGFVIQHRCTGAEILYVCNWRDNNEVWESIYSRSSEPGSRFSLAQRPTKTGTFCVWVIPILMHEQQAWLRFLRSTRDAHARREYLSDMFTGEVG